MSMNASSSLDPQQLPQEQQPHPQQQHGGGGDGSNNRYYNESRGNDHFGIYSASHASSASIGQYQMVSSSTAPQQQPTAATPAASSINIGLIAPTGQTIPPAMASADPPRGTQSGMASTSSNNGGMSSPAAIVIPKTAGGGANASSGGGGGIGLAVVPSNDSFHNNITANTDDEEAGGAGGVGVSSGGGENQQHRRGPSGSSNALAAFAAGVPTAGSGGKDNGGGGEKGTSRRQPKSSNREVTVPLTSPPPQQQQQTLSAGVAARKGNTNSAMNGNGTSNNGGVRISPVEVFSATTSHKQQQNGGKRNSAYAPQTECDARNVFAMLNTKSGERAAATFVYKELVDLLVERRQQQAQEAVVRIAAMTTSRSRPNSNTRTPIIATGTTATATTVTNPNPIISQNSANHSRNASYSIGGNGAIIPIPPPSSSSPSPTPCSLYNNNPTLNIPSSSSRPVSASGVVGGGANVPTSSVGGGPVIIEGGGVGGASISTTSNMFSAPATPALKQTGGANTNSGFHHTNNTTAATTINHHNINPTAFTSSMSASTNMLGGTLNSTVGGGGIGGINAHGGPLAANSPLGNSMTFNSSMMNNNNPNRGRLPPSPLTRSRPGDVVHKLEFKPNWRQEAVDFIKMNLMRRVSADCPPQENVIIVAGGDGTVGLAVDLINETGLMEVYDDEEVINNEGEAEDEDVVLGVGGGASTSLGQTHNNGVGGAAFTSVSNASHTSAAIAIGSVSAANIVSGSNHNSISVGNLNNHRSIPPSAANLQRTPTGVSFHHADFILHIAIIPMGTGNDLSRSLGFGPGFVRGTGPGGACCEMDTMRGIIEDTFSGRAVELDLWKIAVRPAFAAGAIRGGVSGKGACGLAECTCHQTSQQQHDRNHLQRETTAVMIDVMHKKGVAATTGGAKSASAAAASNTNNSNDINYQFTSGARGTTASEEMQPIEDALALEANRSGLYGLGGGVVGELGASANNRSKKNGKKSDSAKSSRRASRRNSFVVGEEDEEETKKDGSKKKAKKEDEYGDGTTFGEATVAMTRQRTIEEVGHVGLGDDNASNGLTAVNTITSTVAGGMLMGPQPSHSRQNTASGAPPDGNGGSAAQQRTETDISFLSPRTFVREQLAKREDDPAKHPTLITQHFNFVNYFSVGFDAHICTEFHHFRENHPKLCSTRMLNKVWYGLLGAKALVGEPILRPKYVSLVVDGRRVPIPEDVKSIVVSNVVSFAGGVSLWKAPQRGKQYTDAEGRLVGTSDIARDWEWGMSKQTTNATTTTTSSSGNITARGGRRNTDAPTTTNGGAVNNGEMFDDDGNSVAPGLAESLRTVRSQYGLRGGGGGIAAGGGSANLNTDGKNNPRSPLPERKPGTYLPANVGDGLLEVQGLYGSLHMSMLQLKVRHSIKIAQGSSIEMTIMYPHLLELYGKAQSKVAHKEFDRQRRESESRGRSVSASVGGSGSAAVEPLVGNGGGNSNRRGHTRNGTRSGNGYSPAIGPAVPPSLAAVAASSGGGGGISPQPRQPQPPTFSLDGPPLSHHHHISASPPAQHIPLPEKDLAALRAPLATQLDGEAMGTIEAMLREYGAITVNITHRQKTSMLTLNTPEEEDG